MNRKQKIIVSTTGIFLVLLILVGLTYAYFLTRINGNKNDKSISVSTANLELVYADVNDTLISATNVEPGVSFTKMFSATNNGNKKIDEYGVALENVINTLERTEDLVYTISCTQYLKQGYSITKDGNNYTVNGTTSGTCNGVSDEQIFPTMGKILVTNSIEDDKVQVYTLVVTYKDTGTDQSIDMNKQFSAKANLVNPSTFGPMGSGTLASAIIDSAEKASETSDTTRTTFGTRVTEFTSISGENERVLNNAPDDYGTSYYYRGNVNDNYVSFGDLTYKTDVYIGYYSSTNNNKNEYTSLSKCQSASSFNVNCTQIHKKGDPILWRIVRINGDGSVRLVLDNVARNSSGNEITTAFYSPSNDNAYVGYMYGTVGSTTYDATHKNINDSTIKVAVDKWYEDNLKTNYANYLSDTLFCNDKTLASNGIGGVATQLGYGTNTTIYAIAERLQHSTGETDITTSKPTFKCAENATNTYSRFTVNETTLSNGNKTNGNLKYPIGLLTADEVSFAGAYKYRQSNQSYYLYNSSIASSWWLSSPYYCNGDNPISWGGSSAYELSVSASDGDIYSHDVSKTNVVRPSINLKAELLVGGGDGTSSNPYTVKIS